MRNPLNSPEKYGPASKKTTVYDITIMLDSNLTINNWMLVDTVHVRTIP